MMGLEAVQGPALVTFLVGFITLLLYWYSTRNFDYWKKRNVKYVKPFPLFGTLAEFFIKPFYEVEQKRYLEFGRVYGHFEGNHPCLSVADPQLLRNIFVKDFNFFPMRREMDTGNEIFDKMVSAVTGEDWKRLRTIITPTFSTGKIKRMMSIIKDCSKTLIQNLNTENQKGDPIDVHRFYGAFAMDVIASSAFSTKLDSHNDPDNEFVQTAKKIFKNPLNWRFMVFFFFPKLLKWLKLSIFDSSVTNFFSDVTLQIIEERKKTGQTRNDFLQLLLDITKEETDDPNSELNEQENEDISVYGGVSTEHQVFTNVGKKSMSQSELVAQCVNFFVAGFDANVAALGHASYMMALHQDKQERVHQELAEALEKTNGELTYEALQSLKYMDSFISETFRILPAAVKIERQCAQDYVLGETGITIPKGMILSIPVYCIHRDPEWFPDPEKFDPERFMGTDRASRFQYTYLPFGAGPRNCVGMRFVLTELKVALAYLVANFKINRCPQTKVPIEFRKVPVLLIPKNIFVSLEPRNDNPLFKMRAH